MSKFVIPIPVDVASVKSLLPKAAYINGVKFNEEKSQVELAFEHDPWKTPYTFPTEMTVEELQARTEKLEPIPAPAEVPSTAAEATGVEIVGNVQTSTQEVIDPEPATKARRSRR